MRRRLFGRSQDSSVSVMNSVRSKESPASSPTVNESADKDFKDKDSTKETLKEKERDSGRDSVSIGSRHARAKRSVDGGRHGDRLSIFGSTFSTSKNRKPPPRYVFLVGPNVFISDLLFVSKCAFK